MFYHFFQIEVGKTIHFSKSKRSLDKKAKGKNTKRKVVIICSFKKKVEDTLKQSYNNINIFVWRDKITIYD